MDSKKKKTETHLYREGKGGIKTRYLLLDGENVNVCG